MILSPLSYIRCSTFFSDFCPLPRLTISVYILSTSTSHRNNTSVSYFIVSICLISIPTAVKSSSSSSQQLPLAFSPFIDLISFIECWALSPIRPPSHQPNPVFRLPPAFRYLLEPHVGGYDTTNLHHPLSATHSRVFSSFNTLFSILICLVVPLVYHMCQPKITHSDSFLLTFFGFLSNGDRR